MKREFFCPIERVYAVQPPRATIRTDCIARARAILLRDSISFISVSVRSSRYHLAFGGNRVKGTRDSGGLASGKSPPGFVSLKKRVRGSGRAKDAVIARSLAAAETLRAKRGSEGKRGEREEDKKRIARHNIENGSAVARRVPSNAREMWPND